MSVCGVFCGQGSVDIVSVSRGCCGCMVLSLSLCDMSTPCPFRCWSGVLCSFIFCPGVCVILRLSGLADTVEG